MALLEQLNDDLKIAMKNKDILTLNVIRMVKGAIQLESIKNKKDLTDEEIILVIAKQIKLRKEAIIEFEKANRDDLVSQNNDEINILNKYMPVQLTNEELTNIIDEAFALLNPTSIKYMGLIMKEISPKVKGKADMSEVNLIIKTKLDNL